MNTQQEIASRSLWYCPTRIGVCLVRVESVQTATFGEPDRVHVTRALGGDRLTFDGGDARDLRLHGFLRRYRPCTDPSGIVVPVLASMLSPTDAVRVSRTDPRQVPMFKEQVPGGWDARDAVIDLLVSGSIYRDPAGPWVWVGIEKDDLVSHDLPALFRAAAEHPADDEHHDRLLAMAAVVERATRGGRG